MSNIISTLHKIEQEIVAYADATGKSIEHISEEVVEFLSGKTQEAVKASGDDTVGGAA